MSEIPEPIAPVVDPAAEDAAGIDPDAIMARIRANIRARRAAAEAAGVNFDALVQALPEAEPDSLFSRASYFELQRLRKSLGRLGVDAVVTQNRTPLVGGLMRRARAVVHQLVIFYVNMLASQQGAINAQMNRVLVEMVKDLEAQSRAQRETIAGLQRDVAALRALAEGRKPPEDA